MIFSSDKSGKDNEQDESGANSDTFRRWREASMKNDAARSQPDNHTAAPGDVPPFVSAVNSAAPQSRSTSTGTTADWPAEEPPIRIVDDSVYGMEGAPASTESARPVSSGLSNIKRSTSSKLAQFVSGLSSSRQLTSASQDNSATRRNGNGTDDTAILNRFSSPVPGSSVQSKTLNSLSVEGKKQLFHQEEQLRTAEDDIRHRFGANLKSALSSGTIIEGKFKFDSPVRIDGTMMGEVQASSLLIVGADASVEAKVKVGSLIVLGVVRGNVEAEELIEIKRGGVLEGDIKCARFAIEEGGWFQGRVNLTTEPKIRSLAKTVEKISSSDTSKNSVTTLTEIGDKQLSLGGVEN